MADPAMKVTGADIAAGAAPYLSCGLAALLVLAWMTEFFQTV